MSRYVFVVLAAFLAVSIAACAPKATKEECTNACGNLADLQKAANPRAPAPDAVAKVNEEYAKKMQDLQNQQTQALQAIDQDLQAKLKLAGAKKEADKKKLTEEAEKAKAAKQQEFAPQVQARMDEKAKALKAAEDQKAKADAEARAAADKALADCADNCLQAGMKKKATECQINAMSVDEYNKCQ